MKNSYEVQGELVTIFIDSPKYGKLEALISLDKLERAQRYPNKWYAKWSADTQSFYVQGKITVGYKKRKFIFLHRFILDAPDGLEVDHINRNTLDNTTSNLRLVSRTENNKNKRPVYRRNASQTHGVYWIEKCRKWRVQIVVNGKPKHFGMFSQLEDAKKKANEVILQISGQETQGA